MAVSDFVKQMIEQYGVYTPTTKVELKAEYDRKRYQANKEKKAEYNKQYYENNKE